MSCPLPSPRRAAVSLTGLCESVLFSLTQHRKHHSTYVVIANFDNMSTANGAPPDPALLESRAHIPIVVVTLVLCLASTAVGLRSYTRAQLIRQFGMDDIAAICALVLAMGSGIMVAYVNSFIPLESVFVPGT